MKKLLIYFRDYKLESIASPVFKLFEACLELFVPFVIICIIDEGIKKGEQSLVVKFCIFLVGLSIFGLIFSVIAQFFAAKASVGFVTKIRHVLFSHIQKLSLADIDKIGGDTIITRLTSDINQIRTGANLTLRLFLRSPFIVFGALLMAFLIDKKMSIIFVIVILILFITVFTITIFCISKYKEVQGFLDKILEKTRENLIGVRMIRAFCKENDEIREFEKSNNTFTRISEKVAKVSNLMNPLTYTIINLGIAALIYQGAIKVENGELTAGKVVALYNYMSQILIELVKFVNLFLNITRSIACGNRVQAILDMQSGMKETATNSDLILKNEIKADKFDEPENKIEINQKNNNPVSENAIEFKNVTLNYNDRKSLNPEENALNNITFSVKKGETVGIIGGTGSGKTSIINLIPRFYDVSEGEVSVNGISVKDYTFDKLRSLVAVTFQKVLLFKGTIRENIKWGNENASDNDIVEAIKIAQADELLNKEGGLDFIIEQEGRNLSGGQRQRLTIARALVGKPEILIFDDSFSALDYATDLKLRKALKNLPYKPTMVIISARISSIKNSDKIIVMNNGEIAGIGKHDELIEKCDIYNEIYRSQCQEA